MSFATFNLLLYGLKFSKAPEASVLNIQRDYRYNLEIVKRIEIGKALIAFNTMSDRLNKNISVLNWV